MRSAFVQIIAVIGMVFALILAVRFWGAEAPQMPALPSFQMPFPKPASDELVEIGCPFQTGDDISQDPQPSWTVPPAPNVSDFPQQALDAGVGGSATVTCLAMPDGRVRDCRVTTETPEGYGFGESTIRIVQRGCLTRFSEKNPPAEFTVRVPFYLD